MNRHPLPLIAALLIGSGPAQATPPLDQVGTLVFSCAGKSNGNSYNGIAQEGNFVVGEHRCKEAFDPLMGKVTAKAGYDSATYGQASARGQARAGVLRAEDSNNSLGGVAGRSISGFTDRLTFSAPGQTGTVTVTYRIRVAGTIETHGASGSALAKIQTHFNGTNRAAKQWQVSTDWTAPDDSLAIDEVVELSQAASLGVPAYWSQVLTVQNGARSINGVGHGNSSIPAPGAVWMGIVKVTKAGVDLADWSVASDSGIDWRLPCPCSLP